VPLECAVVIIKKLKPVGLTLHGSERDDEILHARVHGDLQRGKRSNETNDGDERIHLFLVVDVSRRALLSHVYFAHRKNPSRLLNIKWKFWLKETIMTMSYDTDNATNDNNDNDNTMMMSSGGITSQVCW